MTGNRGIMMGNTMTGKMTGNVATSGRSGREIYQLSVKKGGWVRR